ncbi:MAG TPA: MFS transporter, partial [Corynebacterium nuruki]|nr:MFS transporter [Corynebacterium nuruki]
VTATVIVVTVLAVTGVTGVEALTDGMLIAVVLVAVVTFVSILTAPGVTAAERRNIRAFIPLFIGSSVFWAMLNQNFGVLAVYSDLRLDRTLLGWEMPAAWTQSLNPVFLLIAIPVTGWVWSHRRAARPGASPAHRMSVGVAMAGAGMLVFVPFADGGEASTPLPVLVTAILLITLGEINVGPVGMAAAGDLAPARFATRFSALYFLSMAVGTAAAGVVSGFYSPGDPGAERLYFCGCAAVAVATAVALRRCARKVGP